MKAWDTNTLQVVCHFELAARVHAAAMSACAASHCLVAVGSGDTQVGHFDNLPAARLAYMRVASWHSHVCIVLELRAGRATSCHAGFALCMPLDKLQDARHATL